jgi:hypothetical protein
MPAAKQQDNEFLGKEMKYFSQAGFDLDRIHIKVSSPLLRRWIELIISEMPPSPPYMKMLSSMKEPSFPPVVRLSTSPERRLVVRQKISESSTRMEVRMISGGVLSTSRWSRSSFSKHWPKTNEQ